MKTKKTLVITTDTFLPKRDGVTTFLANIIPDLAEHYRIRILAPSYSKKHWTESWQGVEVVRFPVSSVGLSGYPAVKATPWRVKPYLKDADIVWVNSAAPLGASAIMATRSLKKKGQHQHIKLIAFIHSIEWDQLTHVVLRSKWLKNQLIRLVAYFGWYFYNKCDHLMVPSEGVAQVLVGKHIKPPKTVVPLGVDSDCFTIPTRREKFLAKRRLGYRPNDVIIGYCGRLSPEKDVETLAEACALLRKNNSKLHRNLKLLIVGDGNHEDVTDFLDDNYKITGFVKNVIPYLHAMDIFVMPSLTETTSLATLEAMSCGLPVVATPVGHMKDYVIKGYNGFFFPKEEPKVLAQKLYKLIQNPSLRERVGKKARKTVLEKYTWERTILKLQRLLDTL